MLLHFCLYGLVGWCLEIIWTSLYSVLWPTGPRDWRLVGRTYLWMFPIYGLAGITFEPIHDWLRDLSWFWRASGWALLCFAIEYASGWLLQRLIGRCPWDYSYNQWHIHGFIRLDYTPLWMFVGLLFERIHDAFDAVLGWLGRWA